MVFSSYLFVFLFLPIFLTLHRAMPARLRNAFILIASVLFYYFGDHFGTLVLGTSVLGNYTFGRLIGRSRNGRTESAGSARVSGLWLTIGVVFNLALLGWFKYIGLLTRSIDQAGASLGFPHLVPVIDAVLPLGISFFAFQGISYLVDVHRRTVAATHSLLDFATYKTLFPQLIAGPIVRYNDVAAELHTRVISEAQRNEGTRRFVIGFCKKVLIADTIAATADAIFALPPGQLGFATAWLGAIAYGLQIYFDFSGYSDMAIGLGLIMGFRFPENFNHPYISRSVREFWRRWHMTLSSWFRDYLYFPLGGNRRGRARTYANLLIVFTLTGLWHGAAWTFVAWGLWHGMFLVFERVIDFDNLPIAAFLRRTYVLVAVIFGWVLFRSESFGHALTMSAAMLGIGHGDGSHPVGEYLDALQVVSLCAGIVFSMPVAAWLGDRIGLRTVPWARTVAGAALFAVAGMKVLSGAYSPFLYFRF